MFTGMKNSEEDDRRCSPNGSTLCTTLRVPTGTGFSFTILETTAAAADPLTHDGTCKDRLIVHHASIIWTLGVMLYLKSGNPLSPQGTVGPAAPIVPLASSSPQADRVCPGRREKHQGVIRFCLILTSARFSHIVPCVSFTRRTWVHTPASGHGYRSIK